MLRDLAGMSAGGLSQIFQPQRASAASTAASAAREDVERREAPLPCPDQELENARRAPEGAPPYTTFGRATSPELSPLWRSWGWCSMTKAGRRVAPRLSFRLLQPRSRVLSGRARMPLSEANGRFQMRFEQLGMRLEPAFDGRIFRTHLRRTHLRRAASAGEPTHNSSKKVVHVPRAPTIWQFSRVAIVARACYEPRVRRVWGMRPLGEVVDAPEAVPQ